MRAKRREHPERDDARYLELRRAGKTIEMISLLCGVSLATVHKGIAAAKDRQKRAAKPVEPVEAPAPRQPAWVREVVPLFPTKAMFGDFLGPVAPANACPHHGPIKTGSLFCCMVCSQSGMDAHPALRRDPRTDPRPEPAPPAAPLTRESKKERRKRERREAAKARPTTKAA